MIDPALLNDVPDGFEVTYSAQERPIVKKLPPNRKLIPLVLGAPIIGSLAVYYCMIGLQLPQGMFQIGLTLFFGVDMIIALLLLYRSLTHQQDFTFQQDSIMIETSALFSSKKREIKRLTIASVELEEDKGEQTIYSVQVKQVDANKEKILESGGEQIANWFGQIVASWAGKELS